MAVRFKENFLGQVEGPGAVPRKTEAPGGDAGVVASINFAEKLLGERGFRAGRIAEPSPMRK